MHRTPARLIAYLAAIVLLSLAFLDPLTGATRPVDPPLGDPGVIYVHTSGISNGHTHAQLAVDPESWQFDVDVSGLWSPETRIVVAATGASQAIVECLFPGPGGARRTATEIDMTAWAERTFWAAIYSPEGSAVEIRADELPMSPRTWISRGCAGSTTALRQELGGRARLRLPAIRVFMTAGPGSAHTQVTEIVTGSVVVAPGYGFGLGSAHAEVSENAACAITRLELALDESMEALTPDPFAIDEQGPSPQPLPGLPANLRHQPTWRACTGATSNRPFLRTDLDAELNLLTTLAGRCDRVSPCDALPVEVEVSTPPVSGLIVDPAAEGDRERSLFLAGAALGLIGALAVEWFGLLLAAAGGVAGRLRKRPPAPAASARSSGNEALRRLRRTASRGHY